MPGGAPGGAPGGVTPVDPGAEAVAGQMPKGVQMEQATPEEQQEYERAMKAMSAAIYGNDKIADAIVNQIKPDDKVSSTAKASIMFVQQLDEQIQLDEAVVAEVTQEATSRLMELAESRHGIEYGGREQQVILGAAWEGVQSLFGMDEQQAQSLMSSIGDNDLADLKGQHEGFLNG